MDDLTPEVQAAFVAAIEDVQSSAQLSLIIGHLENGDISSAVAALNLSRRFFAPLDKALADAFYAGGVAAMANMPRIKDPFTGAIAVARWDMSNPSAETWLRNQSSTLIVTFLEEIKENARQVLADGMAANRGPRSVALDLVGRVENGVRRGGIIGLDDNQIAASNRAFAELRGGDPSDLGSYLRRKTRDRRFDGVARRYLSEGKPVPAETASRMIQQMRNKQLKVRGERIARTELMQSLHQSQEEAYRQMIEEGHFRAEDVTDTWDASNDSATRDSHRAMDGQQRGEDGLFTTGAGFKMLYPGDSTNGAPAEEVINCRCVVIKQVDFIASLGR